MIRILHLSDFHLNTKNLRDWNDYVKDAMITKLIELNLDQEINFIASTGDQIDKGGEDFKSAKDALILFNKDVITPIIECLNISKSKFFLIPGNHDIDRSKDSELIEAGSLSLFKDLNKLASHMVKSIKEESYEGMKRIKEYKDFEKGFYESFEGEMDSNVYATSFKFDDNKIGVCCLNNSWRCFTNNDTGNLLIGEQQLIRATKFITDCDLKVALLHHPLDGLSKVERKTITQHIHQDFDILLLGHSHEVLTTVRTEMNGSLFINLAPSGINDIRSDSRTFSNGFTVIDYDKTGKKVECEYWRYNHNKRQFVLNTDEGNGDGGKTQFPILSSPPASKKKLIKKTLENLREDHFIKLDKHLIGARADVSDVTIKEGFVFPPISKSGEISKDSISKELVTLSQIIKSKSNLCFFGSSEAGKTALLYRLVREYVDEYEYIKKIPIYIDFNEIENKEISTCIKEYLRCSSSEVTFFLKNKLLVLLIDNLNYNKHNNNIFQINKLHRFFESNEEIRIVATGESEITGIAPRYYLEACEIPFINHFINRLRAKEIKKLMKIWIPKDQENDLKIDVRLEKMVSAFESYTLPSTAMSVSLFLWSTEYSDKEPINSAVLLEIYIEIILEKFNPENIYRKTFDFTNKVQLLASIAEEMYVKDELNYSIKFSEFTIVIEQYLENKVGFEHDPNIIMEYFIERKIFMKYHGNRIKFSKSCFFHFFLAKRMIYNTGFKEHVMSEEEYCKFHKEIDYYTGLTRSDKEVFSTIYNRFLKVFESTDFILKLGDIDEYFTPKRKKKSKLNKPVAENIELNKIVENRPSEEMLEELHNRRLEKIKNPNTIIKTNGDQSLDKLLLIMSNVLKNSEGVEDLDLKGRAYNSIIKYSMTYMILHKEAIIDFVIKNDRYPSSIPLEMNLINYLTNIPLYVHLGMLRHLGTPKLNTVIKKKIIKDRQNKTFDIEKFLSVALYADLNGKNFDKDLKTMIKKLKTHKKNYIVTDYTLYKLIEYFYRRTREGSPNERMYLDLIAELKIRSQKLPKGMRLRIMKTFEDAKRKYQTSIKLLNG